MKRELERRPLLFLLGALIIGLTAISNPFNLLLLGILLWLGGSLRNRIWTTGGFLLGLLLIPQAVVTVPKGLTTEVTVNSKPVRTVYGWSARGSVGGIPMSFVGSGDPPQEGQVLTATGLVTESTEPKQPGIFKLDRWLVREEASLPMQIATRWRESLRHFLGESSLAESDRSFLAALCFGTDLLTQDDMREARALGWIRILSASGIQVLAVAMLVEGVFRLIPIPRPALLVFLTAVLWIYALAAGHHASTERAVLIVVLARWAYLFQRQSDTLSATALSGVVIMILDPFQVYSLGYHLTMLAVAAFALFGVRIPRRARRLVDRLERTVQAFVRAVLIGSLATVPLVAQELHEASFAGVVAVSLVLSVVPILVMVTLCAHILSVLAPSAGLGLVEMTVVPMTQGLRAFLELGSSINPSFEVPGFSGYFLLIYYGVWLLFWGKRARPA